jgi:trigger factor
VKIDVQEPTQCKRVLDIEIPSEEVKKEFQKKIGKYRQTAQVPGFRKGKVPVNIILTRFSKAIMSETVEELINHSFDTALKEKQMVPVNQATIDKVDYGDDKPLKFQAEFEIEPQVELSKYTGLGIEIKQDAVDDKNVEQVLVDLRDRMASFTKAERASKKDDYIKYSYSKVVVDGKERADYKNPEYPVPIGDAKIKEFNKALVGIRSGEEITVKFNFPKDYEAEEVRGQAAEFTLNVHEVLEKKLPELDDDFAKKIGNYQTVEELKNRVRDDLVKNAEQASRNKGWEKVLGSLIEHNELIVPDSRVDHYAELMFAQMKKQNTTLEKDEALPRYRELGAREIKQQKIIDWVAKKENIKASQEEVDEKIKEFAESRKQNFEELKERFRKEGTTLMIRNDIKEQKTIDWLLENNRK